MAVLKLLGTQMLLGTAKSWELGPFTWDEPGEMEIQLSSGVSTRSMEGACTGYLGAAQYKKRFQPWGGLWRWRHSLLVHAIDCQKGAYCLFKLDRSLYNFFGRGCPGREAYFLNTQDISMYFIKMEKSELCDMTSYQDLLIGRSWSPDEDRNQICSRLKYLILLVWIFLGFPNLLGFTGFSVC